MTTTTQITKRPTVLLWQETEQAIAFLRYNGTIEICQGKNLILLDDESVKEFIKAVNLSVGSEA